MGDPQSTRTRSSPSAAPVVATRRHGDHECSTRRGGGGRAQGGGTSLRNSTMISRLPAWLTAAKNRDEVLRRIARLRASVL